MRNIARSLRAEAPFFEHIRSQSIKTITLNNKGNETDKKQRIRGSCLKSNLPFLQPLQNLPILWSFLMLIATTQSWASPCAGPSPTSLCSLRTAPPSFSPSGLSPMASFPLLPVLSLPPLQGWTFSSEDQVASHRKELGLVTEILFPLRGLAPLPPALRRLPQQAFPQKTHSPLRSHSPLLIVPTEPLTPFRFRRNYLNMCP